MTVDCLTPGDFFFERTLNGSSERFVAVSGSHLLKGHSKGKRFRCTIKEIGAEEPQHVRKVYVSVDKFVP